MKKEIFFIVITALLSCRVCAHDFIHATYLVGHNLKNADKVKQIDYQNYQYIYLMAAPHWNQEDFTCPQEEIIHRLVTNHQYAKDKNIEVIPLLIEQAHKNGTKVLLSFAGDGFLEKVSSVVQQQKLIDMIIKFVDKYNYDGVEIDWEKDFSISLHVDFLFNLRIGLDNLSKACNNKKLYLTTAVHSYRQYNKEQADKLSQSVDWINIMTYDLGGGIWGNVAKHNTSLKQIEINLRKWEVFDRKKLCIGLANYGFIYKNLKPEMKIKGKLNEFGKYISYNDMLPLLKQGWKEEYDTDAKVSYYYSSDRSDFVTIENANTILTKIQWIVKEQYGGVFWWEFSYDSIYPTSKEEKVKHHLIDVVSKYLDETVYK